MSPTEALPRHRAIVIAALVILGALSWAWLWTGAGMGMSVLEMTRLSLFPHTLAARAAGTAMAPAAGWLLVAAMWWVMMIAMMTPSAAPLVLLHARVLRHATQQSGGVAALAWPGAVIASSCVVCGYLVAWLLLSLAAAGLQLALARSGLLSPLLLSSRSALLSAGVLVAAGLYQLSPLKQTCLRHCRAPAQFLAGRWRPGPLGALATGIEHGAWCIGCCWLLMALLFVGGVMNLAWIALLTLLVVAEKLAPRGVATGRIVGGLLIVWGLATLAT
ncbi:MAG TPA: DUF2182 domain-containing protein [Rhodanobacteraceae bacterium]|nr:DUF2182 domain-containing protein [Rhodanobacteraceae bacterium]